jgi:hypothetical protein
VKLGIALAVALIAAGFIGYRHAHQTGYGAGAAAVRAEWGTARARASDAATEALRATHAAYMADIRRREEVERELDAKLDAATRRGRDLARRLRAQACPLPGASHDTTAPADGASGVTGDAGAVGEALAAHLAACERDAERFGELQRWLTP